MHNRAYCSAKVAACWVGKSVRRYLSTSAESSPAVEGPDDLPTTRPMTPQEPRANTQVVIRSVARSATCVRRPPPEMRPPGLGTSKSRAGLDADGEVAGPAAAVTAVCAAAGAAVPAVPGESVAEPAGAWWPCGCDGDCGAGWAAGAGAACAAGDAWPPRLRCSFSAFFCS